MYDTELLDLLAGQMIPKRDFWQIALDGSGPVVENDRFYAFAGVMGSAASWGAFRERWEAILNEYDVPYLRMAEAMKPTVKQSEMNCFGNACS
jgi:hypothetical protein